MKENNAQSGFTLVEMLVALAVFMIVAVVAVAALLKIVDANRQSQSLQDAINNINFTMDDITREIRVGDLYTCKAGQYSTFIPETGASADCTGALPSGGTGASIAFHSSNTALDSSGNPCNLTYAYYFAPHPTASGAWTIEKAQQSSGGHCTDSLGTVNDPYAPIIDPSIVITNFYIKGITSSGVQPSIFLYISGYTGAAAGQQTYFDIQTTISQRS